MKHRSLSDVNLAIDDIEADGLVNADIGVTVQAYDVNTAKTDVAKTFTKPQRTSIVAEDNIIDFTTSQNFTLTATAAVIGTPTITGCVGQSGIITITTAENITGWDGLYYFPKDTVPTDLTGIEIFAYFIESLSEIRIGRVQ